MDIKIKGKGNSYTATSSGHVGHGPGPLSAAHDLIRRMRDARARSRGGK